MNLVRGAAVVSQFPLFQCIHRNGDFALTGLPFLFQDDDEQKMASKFRHAGAFRLVSRHV